MRIVRDVEGDLWEETEPGKFTCRTGGYDLDGKSLKWLEARYGPVTVYAPVELEA